MLKKVLMITVYLVLGYQAKGFYSVDTHTMRAPASQREASSVSTKMKNICTIQAGDVGRLRYKGSSYEQAFSKVTDACFQKRTQLYIQARQAQPSQDRQIQFAEACVNAVQCI